MDLGFTLDSNEIARKCIAILGIRGSGKSNTAKVLASELIADGYPVVIIDPDGEYELNAITIDNFDLDTDILAKQIIYDGKSTIIDMNEWNNKAFNFLFNLLDSLWNKSKVGGKSFFILLEEAHEFIPQNEKTRLSEEITRIALRGRKRGIGMILVSQRSAKINKDVLTQSEIYFLHKVVHPADIKVYREILPWKAKDVESVKSLEVGEAFFYVNGTVNKVKVKKYLAPIVPTSLNVDSYSYS
ncbi:ATP-binding protein [Acidianus sp. RZ1]|uniref:ATP-binding protein n=1 Tax=Acidianus sp. RZ1 TaxID=1540082 RepID=UPI001490D413|nr:DUF87 domain-containing protein [Acidianus sp. RZ1]NON62944.1 ATP-binding protein [Acidianus sp. RZ1]